MTFAQALLEACTASAVALGEDVKKISWLMSNQSQDDHVEEREAEAA